MDRGFGFGVLEVWGFGLWVKGFCVGVSWFKVLGFTLGFRVTGSGFGVSGTGIRVRGFMVRGFGSGFQVSR